MPVAQLAQAPQWQGCAKGNKKPAFAFIGAPRGPKQWQHAGAPPASRNTVCLWLS